MEVIIQPDSEQASQLAARLVKKIIMEKDRPVLGLPTGNTPLLLYRYLVEMHRKEGLNFSRVVTFNLDEYVGLSPDHPASFHYFMWKHLFSQVNIRPENVHIPDGLASDMEAHCRQYEEEIKVAGGLDIQILGIGTDGHIGFNEPTSSLSSRTRIKTLTEQTRKENATFFGAEENVPYHAITMGIGTILEAKICLLLAFGKKKARAIAQAIEGPVTSMVTASALQFHPRAIILLDEEAASELRLVNYYQWVYEHKPEWQKF
ncbi:MAG TPA: glucosamine-6-phosphate deaminase [Candidatus Saccharicenans sp.]|jgi:glucosamine-6-phosphate deaminase|nr:glucosamine-6-phosphate deaminase [Candidatus Saccharicenans sp.]HNT00518.1 glucosamine-6-phosphate deaminase [Candidatus Saccharicenans sp.]HPB59288.1 glucosamine-6-phosphate deaminase [Candidatus Saccharicenans sp.]HQO75722.1 glucosamine-6-phosphate deaminase [Candidatus Saccharicenans sp.]HUM79306.1 glucosamine-6-phosphate deaminase [Candidatus Saccharicenans sp.]